MHTRAEFVGNNVARVGNYSARPNTVTVKDSLHPPEPFTTSPLIPHVTLIPYVTLKQVQGDVVGGSG